MRPAQAEAQAHRAATPLGDDDRPQVMSIRTLGRLDTALHYALDGYIDRQWVGWGALQLAQWHVCNAYEQRLMRL